MSSEQAQSFLGFIQECMLAERDIHDICWEMHNVGIEVVDAATIISPSSLSQHFQKERGNQGSLVKGECAHQFQLRRKGD